MKSAPLLSMVTRPGIKYPPATWGFSPDQAYPEYVHGLVAPSPNNVYAAVRDIFAQAGLDSENFGSAAWNPLGRYISPGQRVFILCNFVYHQRAKESDREFLSKCTHASVIRAVADYVLIATGATGVVQLGNAPLQSANWTKVLHNTEVDRLLAFYHERNVNVEARDLRLFIAERSASGAIRHVHHNEEPTPAVNVDLGSNSLLDELSGQRFRVVDYDPRRTESFHGPGRHIYVVHRDVLNADVVLSVPKLKTHEKVGITVGLKGFVGSIGHKDCLAHHRRGAPSEGGDEYPEKHFSANRPVMSLHEWLQTREASRAIWNPLRIIDRTLRRIIIRAGGTLGGSWHGNDTAWRMALDIARILYNADREGRLTGERQRRHLVFVDGIIGGEGAGPLAPQPVDSGMLLFGDDVVAADSVCARFMDFDPASIPLVDNAYRIDPYPVTPLAEEPPMLVANDRLFPLAGVGALAPRSFEPPRGWRQHLKGAA
jgi:uncharacterized protein (DUF362 family)